MQRLSKMKWEDERPRIARPRAGHNLSEILIGTFFLWLAFFATGQAETADVRRDAVVEAVEKVMPSVVNIATEEIVAGRDPLEDLFREFFDPYYRRRPPNTQYSLGSGVIIDEEGFILTNFHVVSRARRIWVKLHDGREFQAEKISGTAFTDVAMLKIITEADGSEEGKTKAKEKFTSVKFAADDDLLLGETVLALGNPFGLGASVSRGILSSKSRRPPREGETLDVMDWLQTDAAINPGNSGGPLINLRGELIGINVAVHREGQGIGFAIPIKRVAETISRIYSPEWLGKLWFGARVRPSESPLLIQSVQAESPAGKAGLLEGDRILKIDGEEPRGFIDFHRHLLEDGDQKEVVLDLLRDKKRRTARVRMVKESDFFNENLIRKKIGASVQELTPELARAFGVGGLQGLLVGGIDLNGSADKAKLDRGMVITGMDGQTVVDVTDAAKLLFGKRSGEKTVLELVVSRRRGPFYSIERTAVELEIQ